MNKGKRIEYHGERYAKLKDGSTINLYYGNGSKRNFYPYRNKWYIDHDEPLYDDGGHMFAMTYMHSEIIEFLDEKIIDNDI